MNKQKPELLDQLGGVMYQKHHQAIALFNLFNKDTKISFDDEFKAPGLTTIS